MKKKYKDIENKLVEVIEKYANVEFGDSKLKKQIESIIKEHIEEEIQT